ncbi:CD9 antigen [Anabarilius grahami]|uniref:CD9 antigen n=1 Tax=Anabarilius grahami TaxID=495550 RepID=A0A3N0YF66_ANAGA|nr:CD9 antigen [Anabarilius grahami]
MWLRFGAETRGFFDIDLNTTQFTIGVAVLVVTGALMLLVAVIGDCGACNHSKSALGVLSEELANFYGTIYAQYLNTRSPGQAMTLKIFHNTFDCCGVGGFMEVFVRETCPEGNFLKQLSFPSCPSVILDMFKSSAPLVLGWFLGTAGIMVSPSEHTLEFMSVHIHSHWKHLCVFVCMCSRSSSDGGTGVQCCSQPGAPLAILGPMKEYEVGPPTTPIPHQTYKPT